VLKITHELRATKKPNEFQLKNHFHLFSSFFYFSLIYDFHFSLNMIKDKLFDTTSPIITIKITKLIFVSQGRKISKNLIISKIRIKTRRITTDATPQELTGAGTKYYFKIFSKDLCREAYFFI